MVSDIYFPIPPSPYPAFSPISYPMNFYPPSPPKPLTPNMSPSNSITKQRHDQVFDANRNHVIPYYYSETLTPCMPNNMYRVPYPYSNRHVVTNPYDDRPTQRSRVHPRLQNSSISPELSQIFSKGTGPQSFRPYSVLETSAKSPIPNLQRPISVVPISDQFRPASVFFKDEKEKSNEVPEWKTRLQKEMPKPVLDKPLRPICRIPNCKCNEKPANNRVTSRFSESRTLPAVSVRSLSKTKNLSLPTLKLDELDKIGKEEEFEVVRDGSSIKKPISEEHLGYI